MSFYAQSQISSRTAGFIPGVTSVAYHAVSKPASAPLFPSPHRAGGLQPPGASHTPSPMAPSPGGKPGFDTLLQDDMAARATTDTPPSGSAPGMTPAAGRHTEQILSSSDHVTAGFRTPDAPDAANAPPQFYGESRTAGRSVSTPDQAAFQANGTPQDFSFWDFIDIINPLQHIPVVSTIYRAITGDDISSPARIMGGAVFGGPVGAAVGVASAIVSDATGRDIGGSVLALVTGGDHPNPVAIAHTTENASFDTGSGTFAAITKSDIIWSQSADTPFPSPPAAAVTEINTAGGAAMPASSSPSLEAEAAPRPSPHSMRMEDQILPSATPTRTHPTPGDTAENRPLTDHSLHQLSKGPFKKAAPPLSVASVEEERNRKEFSYAGQENAGSPLLSSLHEVRSDAAGTAASSGPTAALPDRADAPASGVPADLHLKMMQALDKYQAMNTLK